MMQNHLQTLLVTLGQIGHAVTVLVGRSKAAIKKIIDTINLRSMYTGFTVAAFALLLAEIIGVHTIAGLLVAILAVLVAAWMQQQDDDTRVGMDSIASALVGGGVALFVALIILFW